MATTTDSSSAVTSIQARLYLANKKKYEFKNNECLLVPIKYYMSLYRVCLYSIEWVGFIYNIVLLFSQATKLKYVSLSEMSSIRSLHLRM